MVGRSGPLLVVLALFLSGCTASDEPEKVPLDGPIVVEQSSIGQKVEGFKAGPRFLQQVEWPEHIKNPPRSAPEDEKPGDGYDDGLLVTKRRHTDRSFYEKDLTPGITLSGVHGTSTNPVCLCDLEFVFENKDGWSSTPSINIVSSSWILVDNVTIYGGWGLVLEGGGHDITITRSMFIASSGIFLFDNVQHVSIIDNDFIGHLGPASAISNAPAGLHPCWPDPDGCATGGINLWSADGMLVMHNYFDGGDGVSTTAGPLNNKIIHNTFYNGARMEVSDGASEISWNLARGWSNALMFTAGGQGTRIENNSILLNTKLNAFRFVLDQPTALEINVCDACIVRNNDFIGYGYGYQGRTSAPAMTTAGGSIDASDNYWGTLHDPRLPPDTIIWNIAGLSAITIRDWDLVPNHEIGSVVVSPYPADKDYWLDRVLT